MIGDEVWRVLGLVLGDPVTLRLNIACPDEVVVLPELEQVFTTDPFDAYLWRAPTGLQAALVQLVVSARSRATLARRLQEFLEHGSANARWLKR